MVAERMTANRKSAPRSPSKASSATATVATGSAASRPSRRLLTGVVVSDKMNKTIVVKVDRQVRHRLYKKYVVRSKRYKAHDEKNTAKMGDLVSIISARPMSREKRWALCEILRKGQTVDADLGGVQV